MKSKYLERAIRHESNKLRKMITNPSVFCPLTPFKLDVLSLLKKREVQKTNSIHFTSNVILGDPKAKEVFGDSVFNSYYLKGHKDGEIVVHEAEFDVKTISEFRVIPGFSYLFFTNGEFAPVKNFVQVAAQCMCNNIPTFYYGVKVIFSTTK